MASESCTSWKARSYIGGWNSWTDDFTKEISDGYCYSSNSSPTYAYCFSFKTPSVTKFHKSTSLKFTIPIIRTSSGFATSGTLYFKLLTSDPTGDSLGANLKPTSSSCDASYSWSSNDQQVHKISFTITNDDLEPDTRYYITVAGSKVLGIGYLGYTPSDNWWQCTFNYSTYEDGTAPKIIVFSDQGNNTCLVSGKLGKSGSNNVLGNATLYYTTNGLPPDDSKDWTEALSLGKTSEGSFSKTIPIPAGCTKIYVIVYCEFTYNKTSTGNKSINIYAIPGSPGTPKISYTKKRLTIKENWKVTWAIAQAGNSISPIQGYRFRIYKKPAGGTKFTTIKLYDTSGKLISSDMGTASNVIDHRYYCDMASVSMTIDPSKHDIVPGDTIKIGLYAYTRDGGGDKLFSEGQQFSADYVVRNAGIVNVKVNGSWEEGQVWTKVNGVWKEAETVNAKVSSTWKESQ